MSYYDLHYNQFNSLKKIDFRGIAMNTGFDDSPYRYLSDESKGHVCYRLPVNDHTEMRVESL